MENTKQIVTYNFTDNFIDKVADFLCSNFLKEGKDLSKIACVFGGKRPALFLMRTLSKKIGSAFIPPSVFSIDELMEYIVSGANALPKVKQLDADYYVYNIAKKVAPSILRGRESFNEFLPWAKEIISFIEQLDLENISNESLIYVQKSAAIGYEIPENINILLQHIIEIRKTYHKVLNEKKIYSRGLIYLKAVEITNQRAFDEFEALLFCNFYYLHQTEQLVIKNIYAQGKGICIFQGNQDDWSVLDKTAKQFDIVIKSEDQASANYRLNLYQGFDMQSQVCIAREILKKTNDQENTVIVVSQSEILIPLLSEISCCLDEFNVSMGYPLKRSSLYVLFNLIFKVQESKKENKYYSKDYLNLLKHPLVKNLKLGDESEVTRVLIHKIEDFLQGTEESSIGGSLFLSLSEVEKEDKIYVLTSRTLSNMRINVSADDCGIVLRQLHKLFFEDWENISNFSMFSEKLRVLLNTLVDKSVIWKFPFNLKVIEKLYSIVEELESLSFYRESFKQEEIMEIFRQKLEEEKISFIGSPLRRTQVLGLFETRSLNFENVIVMDANESILPKLKVYEPLMPREVMLSLGLNRLEKEEEIQRYQFMRLISGAKNVHLIYEENQVKEKSRFIEELLWERQKQSNKIEIIPAVRASFVIKTSPQQKIIEKTPEMINFLKNETYSASRLDTYLNCPLGFYYRYVLGLKEKENLLERLESAYVGSFIHELLESAFSKFIGRKPIIDAKFEKYFFDIMEEKFEKEMAQRMKSDSFLLKGIITERLKKFLEKEIERNVSKIICLEDKCKGEMFLNNDSLQFSYIVDRIDEFKDNSIIIIDYKTGGVDVIPKKLSDLEDIEMTRKSIKEKIKSFQLPLYYHFISKRFPNIKVNAELYKLRTLERKPFICKTDYVHKEKIMKICLSGLEYIFSEIFNLNVPFIPDKDERKCKYCPFNGFC